MASTVAPCLRCGRFTMATSVSSTSLAVKKTPHPPIMLWCDRKKRFNWIASLKGGVHVAYHRSPKPRERTSGPSLDVRGAKARLHQTSPMGYSDRKSVVLGKSVSVLVDLGGHLIIKKKIQQHN